MILNTKETISSWPGADWKSTSGCGAIVVVVVGISIVLAVVVVVLGFAVAGESAK
jgi:hypothetical protein